MSDALNLVTADDPPTTLIASASLLSATCRVFADILSLPTGSEPSSDRSSSPPSIDLHEPAIVARAFLDVVQGKRLEDQTVDEETWEGVARLADKFDSALVRRVLEGRIWQLQALNWPPLHAYTLATYLDNPLLLSRTAYYALAVRNRSFCRFGATKEWQRRLDYWEALRRSHLLSVFEYGQRAFQDENIEPAPPSEDYHEEEWRRDCKGEESCRDQGWALLARDLPLLSATMPANSAQLFWDNDGYFGTLDYMGVCQYHIDLAREVRRRMQKYWAKAPTFEAVL